MKFARIVKDFEMQMWNWCKVHALQWVKLRLVDLCGKLYGRQIEQTLLLFAVLLILQLVLLRFVGFC